MNAGNLITNIIRRGRKRILQSSNQQQQQPLIIRNKTTRRSIITRCEEYRNHQSIGIGHPIGQPIGIVGMLYSTKSRVVNQNHEQEIQKLFSSSLENKAWFIEEEEEESKESDSIKEEYRTDTKLTIQDSTSTSSSLSNYTNNNNNNNKIPEELKELEIFLKTSVLFEKDTSIFIDGKKSKGDSAWTDWVVIVTIKSGRESAIRGAAHLVCSILEKISPSVRVEGITPASNNNTWVFIDAGHVVVHILSSKSREIYRLEHVWSDSNLNLDFNST